MEYHSLRFVLPKWCSLTVQDRHSNVAHQADIALISSAGVARSPTPMTATTATADLVVNHDDVFTHVFSDIIREEALFAFSTSVCLSQPVNDSHGLAAICFFLR